MFILAKKLMSLELQSIFTSDKYSLDSKIQPYEQVEWEIKKLKLRPLFTNIRLANQEPGLLLINQISGIAQYPAPRVLVRMTKDFEINVTENVLGGLRNTEYDVEKSQYLNFFDSSNRISTKVNLVRIERDLAELSVDTVN